MVIYIKCKIHEIPSIAYKVMTEYGQSLKFWQSKYSNSSITDKTMMNFHVHNHTMVIYIQYKFHEIPSIGYKVMAEDGKKYKKLGNQKTITPL